ncbi:MAG: DUF4417 domain-containing protein [Candidatus Competibacteraceae bacterium]|nr:DUF4417 domain-containing protein [Candidatus Competibacteraceae bacterium]
MTRSSHNWQSLPGHYDPLHIRRRHYPASNPWGFPDLLPQTFILPAALPLLSYKERDDSGKRHAQALAHFYLDDYRFESVWTKPDAGLSRIRRFWGALTPDFSLYTDWPLIIQQWNHYRRQWLGRYWQEHGIKVIPTVNWSTPDSFDWCFTGIPPNQIVALAVPDIRQPPVKAAFRTGFDAMQTTLQPTRILVYGQLPFAHDRAETLPTDWQTMRQRLQSASKEKPDGRTRE